MKKFYFLIALAAALYLAPHNVYAGGGNIGDPCTDMCDCCAIMMDNFETWNTVNSIEDAVNTVHTFASAYPGGHESILIFQQMAENYADSLGTTYYYTQGRLSAQQICDWGSAGEICATGCEYPGASSEQDCSNMSQWQDANPGYQSSLLYAFVCNTCLDTPDIQYQCAPGYYGSSGNGTSGCTRCPSSGGIYGSSVAGSTSITSCYIPSGASGSDSTGTFTFTGNCYYKY